MLAIARATICQSCAVCTRTSGLHRGVSVGGACVLLQLFMVASGSQRGSGYVRDAAIVTPQRLEL